MDSSALSFGRHLPLAATIIAVASCSPSNSVEADLIFTGGQVVTVDEDFSIAEALAVKDGSIIAVGTSR